MLFCQSSVIDSATNQCPQASHWKAGMVRKAPFNVAVNTTQLSGAAFRGTRMNVPLGRVADLLWKTGVEVRFPGLTDYWTAPTAQEVTDSAFDTSDECRPYYQEGAVFAIFEQIRVKISNIVQELTTSLQEDMEWEWSDRVQRGLSRSAFKNLTVAQMQELSYNGFSATFYPRVWFNLDTTFAYPLLLHGVVSFSLELTLINTIDSLLVWPAGKGEAGDISTANMTSLASAFSSAIFVHTYQVYLTDAERDSYWTRGADYVLPMQQVVVQDYSVPASTVTLDVDLRNMVGPQRAIFFAFLQDTRGDDDTRQEYLKPATGYGNSLEEAFGSAQLYAGSVPYGDELQADQCRAGQAEVYNRNCPAKNYYAFHFCTDYANPASYSGSVALGRGDSCKIRFKWTCTNANAPQATSAASKLHVYNALHNIMRVQKGSVGSKLNVA